MADEDTTQQVVVTQQPEVDPEPPVQVQVAATPPESNPAPLVADPQPEPSSAPPTEVPAGDPSQSRCAQNHVLTLVNKGGPKLPKPEITNVREAGWWCVFPLFIKNKLIKNNSDVCITPFGNYQTEERWNCPSCNYDCCAECYDLSRENYLFKMNVISGDQLNYAPQVAGTIDISKTKLADVLKKTPDEIVAVEGALLGLDVDISEWPFGTDKDDVTAIKAGTAYFSRDGKLLKFDIKWLNPTNLIRSDQDEDPNATALISLGFTSDNMPAEATNSGFPFYLSYSTQKTKEDVKQGVCVFTELRRYGLAEVPGFMGWGEDDSSARGPQAAAMKLLQQAEKDKREILDPLRKAAASKVQAQTGCFGKAPLAVNKPLTPQEFEAIRRKDNDELGAILDKVDMKKKYDVKMQSQKGKIHYNELIEAARLSIMAYVISPLDFNSFFPEVRERTLIDPVWTNFFDNAEKNPGKELLRQYIGSSTKKDKKILEHAHEAFLAKVVADFFVTDSANKMYGFSKLLGETDGPLADMGLQFYQIPRPKSGSKWKGKEGAFNEAGIEGFIAVSQDFETLGGDICISFQGTNKVSDVFVAFNGFTTLFEPLQDGKDAGRLACFKGRNLYNLVGADAKDELRVHLGFYNAFLSVKAYLEEALKSLMSKVPADKNVRIMVTGHSLGGALATLCCAWLLEFFDPEFKGTDKSGSIKNEMPTIAQAAKDAPPMPMRLRVMCVSFGSPKIGTDAMTKWIDNHRFMKTEENGVVGPRFKIVRLLDLLDPIVTLPPSGGPFAYKHLLRRGATVVEGEMVFVTETASNQLDQTGRGLRVIEAKGKNVMLQHDLFRYLLRTLEFTWKIKQLSAATNKDSEVMDTDEFGASKKFHEFTRSDKFLETF